MRRLGCCAALLVLVVATLVTASGPARVAAAAAPTVPSCEPAAPPGVVDLTFHSGGLTRSARVYLPPGRAVGTPAPLLLALHGSGSTAAGHEKLTGLDSTAVAHGFVVAYPQGYRRNGTGYAWNVPGTPGASPHVEDLNYLRELVDLLVSRYCLDPTRVYATGFSGGARMSSALACAPGTPLAALGVVGGLRAPGSCQPGHPVGVIAFHGVSDPQNPFGGHGAAYWTYSVPEAARRWAASNACLGPARSSEPVRGVTLTEYTGCTGLAEVRLYALGGVGHSWPRRPAGRGATLPLTPATLDVDELIWSFFSGIALH
jgi:polyhydroxybutyrate depolymerase